MAEPLKLEHSLPLTQYFIEHLYLASLSPLSRYLSSNIVWVNADMQYFYGYHSVINHLNTLIPAAFCHVSHHHYHLNTAGRNTAVVTGQYAVQSRIFYLTAVWVLECCKLKLLHFHISPMVPEKSHHHTDPCHLKLFGKHGENYFVRPEEITYIEAENMTCHIHCCTKALHVTQSLNQISTALPRYFLRIHRSFIVNSQCVKKVRRYEAELADGAVVPIPEKKYMWVLCQLEQPDFA